jgi:hypothetical protein
MKRLGVLVAIATTGLATQGQACPDAPRAEQGWKVALYQLSDPGPRSRLFPSTPLDTFSVRTGPLRFGNLPNARGRRELPQYVFEGQFRACMAGRYEFQLIMEAAPDPMGDSGRSMMCGGALQEGENTIFIVGQGATPTFIRHATFATRTGSTNLNDPGIYPLRLRISCGFQQYGYSSSSSAKGPDEDYWQSGFVLRVRGPGDNQFRDFRADELFQPG